MIIINPQSIIISSIKKLNYSVKTQRVTEWIKNSIQETHFTLKDTQRLKGKGKQHILCVTKSEKRQVYVYKKQIIGQNLSQLR